MKIVKNKFEVNAREFGDMYFDVGLRSLDSKKEIKGHRVFLASVSPRFEELFDQESHSGDAVVVRNISFDVLSAIIRFAYAGKIDLGEQTPEFVEDFRDGLNMLRIVISDKAEKKIAEELKELKKLSELRKLKEMKEKELRETQGKLTGSESEKRPYGGSDELNNKRQKKDFSNGDGGDDVVTGIKNPRNISNEGENEKSEHSVESSERNCKTGPAFDLRGVLVNKQMIRQIRHSVEKKQRSAEKEGDDCKEGGWLVEPQYREDMYAFDPNNPVANPDWDSDLQVVLFDQHSKFFSSR